jgi:hypothetical protein
MKRQTTGKIPLVVITKSPRIVMAHITSPTSAQCA